MDQSPPELRARLLGTMDLRLGGQQLPPLDSARAESLLAYLLLHRGAPQPRQHLAFLLWPGSAEGQAHTNLRKVLHMLVIRLCRESGDRARAVRTYHACAATLERELGIGPAPGTRVLYQSLVVAAPTGTAPPQTAAVGRRRAPGTSPFVGRAAELARLSAAWRSASSGRAQLVLVTGEAGIGKTRLVDELRVHGYPVAGRQDLSLDGFHTCAKAARGHVFADRGQQREVQRRSTRIARRSPGAVAWVSCPSSGIAHE